MSQLYKESNKNYRNNMRGKLTTIVNKHLK